MKNKEISKIGIVAFIISCSYMITYNMPDYFGIEPFYSWLNNLAIGYIAALIFFIVQVYIPEGRNEKKCMEVLNNNFVDLTRFIDLTILVCEKYITVKEKGAELYWNGDNEKIYFKYAKCGEPKTYNNRSYSKAEIFNLNKVFHEKINQIKSSSIINYCDYDILEKISELEKNKLYETFIILIKFAETEVGFQRFTNNIGELRSLNKDLKALCSISDEYRLEEMDENDKIYADLPRKDLAKELVTIEGFNKNSIRKKIQMQLKEEDIVHADNAIEEATNLIYASMLKTDETKI